MNSFPFKLKSHFLFGTPVEQHERSGHSQCTSVFDASMEHFTKLLQIMKESNFCC